MVIVLFDVGIFFADFLERTHPEVVPVGEDVRLGDQGHHLPLRVVPFPAVLKRPADAPFGPLPRIDGHLGRDFVGGSLLHPAAGSDVHVFGIFTDNDEIEVLRLFVGQRGFHTGKEFHRAEVDILVKAVADTQEQPPQGNVVRHPRSAHRP